MPHSEIDDIFAAKHLDPAPPPPSSKKKHKKRKRDASASAADPSASTPAAPEPETVHDTSSLPPPTMKPKSGKRALKKSRPANDAAEDEARFKDSRGAGPRRKTEEGFAIYKEDELGIKDEGGDTPLCPFDCNCCF